MLGERKRKVGHMGVQAEGERGGEGMSSTDRREEERERKKLTLVSSVSEPPVLDSLKLQPRIRFVTIRASFEL